VTGFDDAEAARPDPKDQSRVIHRADTDAAARNLANLEDVIARACAAMHVAPDAIKGETQSRLNRIMEAAAIELGKPLTKNEAKLRADYDLTYREILRRLKAEKEAATAAESAHNAQGGQPCQ
jgi:hypothetical protein